MLQPTEDVWSTFHSRLRAFLRRRVDSDDVDDILQDVFVGIHRSLQRGDVPRDPTAWVYQIARNAVIDHYRKRAADRSEPHPTPGERVMVPPEVDQRGRLELGRCVRPMIDLLPDEFRDALVWTALDGMSQADAAARAGVSVSGMKSRVQRGRRRLADSLLRCCHVTFDARGAPIDADMRCSKC